MVVTAGSRQIEHLGSAHDHAELESLKAATRQRVGADQAEFDLGLEPAGGGPLPIASSRMGCVLDALETKGPKLIMTPGGRALMCINGGELIWP